MADSCCAPPPLDLGPKKQNRAYRRVLFTVLAINAVMFAVEVIAGVAAGSASLQADALDFLGDAANYAISLLVVGMALPSTLTGMDPGVLKLADPLLARANGPCRRSLGGKRGPG